MITGGITAAAQMLHITQPAVSRLIADLEAEVGVPLFLRKRGGALRPTADAAALFRDVERYFYGLDQIARSVEALRQRRGGRLRVASMPALYLSVLPGFIGAFTAARPGIDVSLVGSASQEIVEWVRSGQADLGLIDWPYDHGDLRRVPLTAVEALAVLPEGHPLTQKEVLQPADFGDEPFISLLQGTQLRREVDHFFQQSRIERRFAQSAHLSLAACSMVGSGYGVSIVDPISAALYAHDGVCFRPTTPAIQITFAAVYLRSSASSGLLQEFLSEFRDGYDQYVSALPGVMARRMQRLQF